MSALSHLRCAGCAHPTAKCSLLSRIYATPDGRIRLQNALCFPAFMRRRMDASGCKMLFAFPHLCDAGWTHPAAKCSLLSRIYATPDGRIRLQNALCFPAFMRRRMRASDCKRLFAFPHFCDAGCAHPTAKGSLLSRISATPDARIRLQNALCFPAFMRRRMRASGCKML
ncbi:hypothetical protein [Nitratireductor sp. GZWM139]|uniref:hypothetical protein n=1 Tax=Nitratireductor sp. GZWM139 TaxID=2950541 RepID=UPI0024BDF29C|nr:hypothetical protein [Nitratireductor sp. GZWM139]MDJ1462700.1 hypothetical protein [Nitratireductor sp. GZWM139]